MWFLGSLVLRDSFVDIFVVVVWNPYHTPTRRQLRLLLNVSLYSFPFGGRAWTGFHFGSSVSKDVSVSVCVYVCVCACCCRALRYTIRVGTTTVSVAPYNTLCGCCLSLETALTILSWSLFFFLFGARSGMPTTTSIVHGKDDFF